METYTLYHVNEFLRRVIALNFSEPIWVTAEVVQANTSRGHTYIELVQKEDGEIIARSDAVVWEKDLYTLQYQHGDIINDILSVGKIIRFKARIDFNERYGLKLIIKEVDAAFTLGALLIERQKLIQELTQKQLINKNGKLVLPLVIQNLAVISSPEAAGWFDFKKHLGDNTFDYAFRIELFSAAMQGVKAEAEIISQLDAIRQRAKAFDCIIIIRGGGSRFDLSTFDTRGIALSVAQAPLPVITGIGHEIDNSVTDLVAHSNLKTPTAVADFILMHNATFETQMLQYHKLLLQHTVRAQRSAQMQLDSFKQQILYLNARVFEKEKTLLQQMDIRLQTALKYRLQKEVFNIETLKQKLESFDFKRTLQRGFTLTYVDGVLSRSNKNIKSQSVLKTVFVDGSVESVVE